MEETKLATCAELKMVKKFALVWWIDEDKFGAAPGDDLFVELETEMKCGKKYCDMEILSLFSVVYS